MLKKEKGRFSLRKYKAYGACSVLLGTTIFLLSVTTPVVANERDSTASVAAENLQRKVELKYTVNYKNSANEIVESFEKIVEKQTNSTDLLEATIAVSADELTSNTILKDYELIDTASGTQNVTLKENEIKEVNFSVQRKKRNVVFKYKILVKDETEMYCIQKKKIMKQQQIRMLLL